MKSEAFGRIIAGPVGSGKTYACIMELFRRACMQARAPDGYRYTRFAIVRQTLKAAKDTILRDCETILSTRGLGLWKVSESTFHVVFDDVRSEWMFIPLENSEDQARLLSMQLTGAWLSEVIEMDIDILGPVAGRMPRYPSDARGQPSWYGMIADTNLPTEMTPWHKFLTEPPPNWQIFRQPGGLTPKAENLMWLQQTPDTLLLDPHDPIRLHQGRKYYQEKVDTFGPDHPWVRRYVDAEFGDDPSGQGVFKATFRPDFHIVDDTIPIPTYPLLIAQDFGRNPWSLICQPDHLGRLLVHQEVPATNIGLEKHVNEHLKPVLWGEKYQNFRMAVVGDPSGVAKGTIAEESCFDALKRLGLAAFPAPTNDIEPRLRAVEAYLGRQTNGGPTLVISRRGCPFLCRAMAGGYRFIKTKQGALKPKPDKLDPEGFSHVADCLQYAALVVHGNMMPFIMQRLQPRRSVIRRPVSAKGWT